ncbi:DUF6134 family protein [Maricaulaceae bacterium MS644]
MFRTLLIAAALGFAGSPALAQETDPDPRPLPQAGEEIIFDVYRKGDVEFGTHTVRFSEDGGDLVATTTIRLRAGLGPVTVFRYEHDGTERWRDDQLIALDGRTLKDGNTFEVSARSTSEGLQVEGVNPDGDAISQLLSAGILPSSHWHGYPADMAEMLNTEHGTVMETTVEYLGETEIEGDGGMITVGRYRLSSTLTVELFYDQNGRWAGCEFEARGQTVRYVRRADPVTG